MYRTLATIERPRPGSLDGLARSLVLYARTLITAGRHQEALAAVDESLSVPGTHASGTQTALAIYLRSDCLADMDRLDEGLVAARESLETYRSAKPRRRDRRLGSPVYALWMCAWVLGRLPRTEESVAVPLECVDLLRAMNPWQLFQLRVVRTRVLMEVTSGLRALGRYDEALVTGVEAREGVPGKVPRFAPDHVPPRARLLTDLAWCYGATGDLRRACDSAEEAVGAARALAARDPATGEPWLALALQCQAHHLGELDAPADAQRALCELADLCTRLAVTDPDAYEPQLADALDDLATLHWRADDPAESIEAQRRSVDVHRRIGERQPGASEAELARTLARLSIRQLDTGEQQAAVESGTEALAITRRLAESDWDARQPAIATRLQILARALHRSGDEAGAMACYEEAETLLRELMDIGAPEPYEAALTATLTALAHLLRTTAEVRLNEASTDDAVAALRRLLALTARTKQTNVHAICIDAFTLARAQKPDAVRDPWQRVTTDPLPSFVYRIGSPG